MRYGNRQLRIALVCIPAGMVLLGLLAALAANNDGARPAVLGFFMSGVALAGLGLFVYGLGSLFVGIWRRLGTEPASPPQPKTYSLGKSD